MRLRDARSVARLTEPRRHGQGIRKAECGGKWWKGLDSNQCTLTRADLQSAAFNHSATLPSGLLRTLSEQAATIWADRAGGWSGRCSAPPKRRRRRLLEGLAHRRKPLRACLRVRGPPHRHAVMVNHERHR